jgi:hypothetical protein
MGVGKDIAGEEPAMRVRIIYGKLKSGTWDAYETAYKEFERAGSPAMLATLTLVIRSASGRTKHR